MRMRVGRNTIDIIPENSQDEAYIEEVLAMTQAGDVAKVQRINVIGMGSLAYITIMKEENKQ